MGRGFRALAGGTLLFVLGTPALAISALTSDLQIPGASARFGWGGGFLANSWNDLELEADLPGHYQLILQTQEGRLRDGLVPVSAELEISDGTGVRTAKLELPPLRSRRAISLELIGPTGRRKILLEPFAEPNFVLGASLGHGIPIPAEALGNNPAHFLGARSLELGLGSEMNPSTALALLAAGIKLHMSKAPLALEALKPGLYGLGRLEISPIRASGSETENTDDEARIDLEPVLTQFRPKAPTPTPQNLWLALWSVLAFAGSLIAYSVWRSAGKTPLGIAVTCVLSGVFGTWALTPSPLKTRSHEIYIGAGGWGLRTTLTAHAVLQELPSLPPNLRVLDQLPLHYTATATQVKTPPWSELVTYTAPSAAIIELRVHNLQEHDTQEHSTQEHSTQEHSTQEHSTQEHSTVTWQIENNSAQRLERLYIVGYGEAEPLEPHQHRSLTQQEPPSASEFTGLPLGTAIAWTKSQAVIIALPTPKEV